MRPDARGTRTTLPFRQGRLPPILPHKAVTSVHTGTDIDCFAISLLDIR